MEYKATDALGRVHALGLRIPSDYPAGRPTALVTLPVGFEAPGKGERLASIFARFDGVVAALGPFWRAAESLDRGR